MNNKLFKFSKLRKDLFFKKYRPSFYQLKLLKGFAKKYELKNKVVLEIGSDTDLNVAKMMIALGVKKVYCVNPVFKNEMKSPDSRIVLLNTLGEQTNLSDSFFDIVFGIALIEHVYDLNGLISEINRMLKQDGIAFLQGCPMYCSALGHHVHIKTNNELKYEFCKKSKNPFLPWEHLCFQSDSDCFDALIKKGIPDQDANLIIEQLYSKNFNHITKRITSEILKEISKISDVILKYETKKYLANGRNKFYYQALEKYSKFDLESVDLRLYISKKK